MSTHSLSSFTTFIRRMLALNLPEALWVKAELAQASHSRGHVFLSLIEKDEASDTIKAQIDAVIWQQQLRKIAHQRGKSIIDLLQTGLELRLKVTADFHDRFGFKLIVKDIDPVHTLGKLAIHRQAALNSLQKAGLLKKQQALGFPLLPQRVAIISSETAAGYADFKEQLTNNPAQFAFKLELFPAAMQGESAPVEIKRALKRIERRKAYFDLVVIIRGGGARMDLLAFDDLELCQSIAETTLPVLTGIGHETDEVLIDHVAYGALKTPTAVAAFLLNYYASLEQKVVNLGNSIQQLGLRQVQDSNQQLQQLKTQLLYLAKASWQQEANQLAKLATTLPLLGQQQVRLEEQKIAQYQTTLAALDPQAILKRGYAILSQDNKIIRSIKEISVDSPITASLADGDIELNTTDQ